MISFPNFLSAQSPISTRFLDSLLKFGEKNFSLLKSKASQIQALQSGVQFKKEGLIPQVTASYQVDYATYNNITGMIYPQFIIPISGPPSSGNNYSAVPGSALSLNLNWDPITFGLRKADIELAKSRLVLGYKDQEFSIFQQKILIIKAWLNYSLLSEIKKVLVKNRDRADFNYKQGRSLVLSGLRPGTDSAILNSEKIKSEIQLIAFKQKVDSSRIQLDFLIANSGLLVYPSDSSFFNHLPEIGIEDKKKDHPELSRIKAAIAVDEQSLRLDKKSALPKLNIWASGYGRGSGIAYNGLVNADQGWGLQRFNYGIGAQISVPVLEVLRQKSLWKEKAFTIQSNKNLLELSESQISSVNQLADSALKSSISLAKMAPELEKLAEFSYKAIGSRYSSGLVTYYELINSEQELIKAQVSRSIAYYQVWNNLLNKASYSGDLEIFLSAYRR